MLSASGRAPRAGRRGGPSPADPAVAEQRTAVHAASSDERRQRIAFALGRAAHDQRLMLALLLLERLSAAEAASVLGIPVRRLRGSVRRTLADLRAAALGDAAPVRAARARRPRAGERFRKAS